MTMMEKSRKSLRSIGRGAEVSSGGCRHVGRRRSSRKSTLEGPHPPVPLISRCPPLLHMHECAARTLDNDDASIRRTMTFTPTDECFLHTSSARTPLISRPNTFVLATSLHALFNGVQATPSTAAPISLNASASCNFMLLQSHDDDG